MHKRPREMKAAGAQAAVRDFIVEIRSGGEAEVQETLQKREV